MFTQRVKIGHESGLPTATECAIHLRLLTAFAYLKEDICSTPDLYLPDLKDAELPDEDHGTQPSDSSEPLHELPTTQEEVEDIRWTIFLARAVKRFERWHVLTLWKQLDRHRTRRAMTRRKKASPYEALQACVDKSGDLLWCAENFIPLDVLMVMHAYMLNPRWFLDDCMRLSTLALWKAGMPWAMIDAAIDRETLRFDVPQHVKDCFRQSTHMSWNFDDTDEPDHLFCHECTMNVRRADTTAQPWWQSEEKTLLASLPCHDQSHLDRARLALFERHLRLDDISSLPLRGTVLDQHGVVNPDGAKRSERRFPGNIARYVTDQMEIHNFVSLPSRFTTMEQIIQNRGMTIRLLKSNPLTSAISSEERSAFNRVKMTYCESINEFSIDLAAAVKRQGKFVQQMFDFAWVHAPALEVIIDDLIDDYSVFMQIMRDNRADEIAVPTLALDLAWHTHQLSPNRYYNYCMENVNGVFIDHDDRVGEGDLTKAFARTAEKYSKITGGSDYSECLDWYGAAHTRLLMDTAEKDLDDDDQFAISEKAVAMVCEAQMRKFKHDYERSLRTSHALAESDFAASYVWLCPTMKSAIYA